MSCAQECDPANGRMKVRKDLVFDHSGEVIGFVDVGDINSRIQALEAQCRGEPEEEVATHMLTLMVRGIQIKLEVPFAHFSTTGQYSM